MQKIKTYIIYNKKYISCYIIHIISFFKQISTDEIEYRSVSNAFLHDNNKKSESRNETPDSGKVSIITVSIWIMLCKKRYMFNIINIRV